MASSALAGVAGLGWLAGTWRMQRGDTRVEEHWTRPEGDMLLGVGRTVTGGRTIFFEFLRVETRDTQAHETYYIAQPRGGLAVEFRLVHQDEGAVTFENRAHDFPQVIRYRSPGPGKLVAEVEGPQGGQTVVETFHYEAAEAP